MQHWATSTANFRVSKVVEEYMRHACAARYFSNVFTRKGMAFTHLKNAAQGETTIGCNTLGLRFEGESFKEQQMTFV